MADSTPSQATAAATDTLFTREEVLAGLPGRRARRVLFEIERHTARLTERWQTLVALSATPDGLTIPASVTAELLAAPPEGDDPLDRDRLAYHLPLRPTIRDIERQATEWADRVPASPRVRAAVAHLLAEKHRFTQGSVPGLRSALALDDAATRAAYEQLYGRPLETIYAPRITARDRLRWAMAAPLALLDRLPPFWAAFILLLVLPLPQSLLAMPIAAADVGALAGVAILLVIGAINVLTVGYTAESVARSRVMRYGASFVGRLGEDFLGGIGAVALTLSVALLFFLALTASELGLSRTLAATTGLPVAVWMVALLVAVVALVVRGRQGITLDLMLILGATNIVLILAVALLSLTGFATEHLDALPLFEADFSASRLASILGVALMCLFGHPLIGQASRVILPRDPSGRALLRGGMAGTACLVALVGFWTLAVSGALPPSTLANHSGTVIAPLAEEVGRGTGLLGSILVVTALGLTAIRCALVVSNLTLERLPTREPRLLDLPRQGGRLVVTPGRESERGPRLGIAYLGLTGGVPRLHLDLQGDGDLQHREIALTGRWRLGDEAEPSSAVRRRGDRLWLEAAAVSDEAIRLRIGTPLSVTYRPERGVRLADLLAAEGEADALLRLLQRRGPVTAAEVAALQERDEGEVERALDVLVEQGSLTRDDGAPPRYRAQFARRRGRALPGDVWSRLDEPPPDPAPHAPAPSPGERAEQFAFGPTGRLWLSMVPVLIAFAIGAALHYAVDVPYAAVLSFTGVVTVSVFGGLLPPLLLIAGKRKGEIIGSVTLGRLGWPPLAIAISGASIVVVAAHGLVIWEEPVKRVGALLLAVAMLAACGALLRRGLFKARVAVELRVEGDRSAGAIFAVVGDGRPLRAAARFVSRDGEESIEAAAGPAPDLAALQSATFRVPATGATSLRVWAHRVTADGESHPLPALLTVRDGARSRRFDLQLSGGSALLPIGAGATTIEIALAQSGP